MRLDPHRASTLPRLQPAIEEVNGQSHLTVKITLAPGAMDSQKNWETSSDLRTWTPNNAALQLLSVQPKSDGTAVFKYVDPATVSDNTRFIRMRVSGW